MKRVAEAAGRPARLGLSVLGLFIMLAAWEAGARDLAGIAVASPAQTWEALFRLVGQGEFLRDHLAVSLGRVVAGLGAGVILGAACGVLAGAQPALRWLLAPMRWALTSVPGVVVVMIAMLWLGMGDAMAVFIVAAMTTPVIYVSVSESLSGVDPDLLEMARLFRLPPLSRLWNLYAMAMAGPLLSGAILALGGAIRVVVLAEALGANQGLGHRLALARTNLDASELYALALLCMGVVGVVELAILGPVRRKLLRRGQ